MAEFLNQPKRELTPGDEGFNAFGKEVPLFRRQAALEHIREIGVTSTKDAWECVGGMAEEIARDQPYKAIEIGMRYVDLTGTYRIMAVLCTAQEKA